MTTYHGAGLEDHPKITGGTAYKDGLETAASAASGYAVTNIDDIRPDTAWRAADTDPANTRLLYRLDKRQSVGAVALAGLEEMVGKDAACRVRWDNRWMEKPAIGLVTGDSPFTIAETASWTLSVLFRHPGALFSATEVPIFDIAKTGAASATTRLASVAAGPDTGTLRTRVERCGGVSQTTDHSAAAIDDGEGHWLDLVCTDAGGSGATISVYFDGVDLGDHTITTVFGTNTSLAVRLKAGAHIGFIALYSAALSTTDLDLLRCRTLDGQEASLVAGYNVDNKTGTILTDITGTYTINPLSAGTWGTVQNPLALHNPDAAPRWHAWRRRTALVCTSSGAGTVATGATAAATSPFVHVMMLLRFRKRKPSAAAVVSVFGSATTLTNFDWLFELQTSGTLRFRANRHDAGSAVTNVDSTTDVTSGELIRLSARITWAAAMSLAINGTEEATGTAPAYTPDATTQFSLHEGSADFEVAYCLISRRPYTHAEADAILLGTAPVIPTLSTDPEVAYLYLAREGTGTAVANDADSSGATDLTITSSSASWSVDAIDNPAPGALRGTLADRVNQTFWEIAPGVDYDALEILVELFDPEAANAPTLYSLYAYECLWPAVGHSSGQDSGEGPQVELSGARVPYGGPEDTGRALSYTFPKLSPTEADNLQHYAIEARRTRRAGAASPMRPMALIYRTEDRWRWPATCAIIIPDLPRKVLDGSQDTAWEYALEIGGPEVKYGSGT